METIGSNNDSPSLGQGQVLVLDGGFSNELNKRCSFDVHKESLWTAKAILSDPQAIIDTHKAYLEAGADIIETSSYQATVQGFREYLSLNDQEAEQLIRKSVVLAKTAVSEFKSAGGLSKGRKSPLIAGSVGPYGVYLCDGSEYTGTYMDKISKDDLVALHLPRIKSLIEEGVDLLAIETCPSLREAEVIFDILKQHFPSTKAWITFSLPMNEQTRDSLHTAYGDPLETAFIKLSKYSQLWGFGINCCSPIDAKPFLTKMNDCKKRVQFQEPSSPPKFIVYPNSGQQWKSGSGWTNDIIPTLNSYVKDWIELGAEVIGGCCQVGSNDISRIKNIVDEHNNAMNPGN